MINLYTLLTEAGGINRTQRKMAAAEKQNAPQSAKDRLGNKFVVQASDSVKRTKAKRAKQKGVHKWQATLAKEKQKGEVKAKAKKAADKAALAKHYRGDPSLKSAVAQDKKNKPGREADNKAKAEREEAASKEKVGQLNKFHSLKKQITQLKSKKISEGSMGKKRLARVDRANTKKIKIGSDFSSQSEEEKNRRIAASKKSSSRRYQKTHIQDPEYMKYEKKKRGVPTPVVLKKGKLVHKSGVVWLGKKK